MKMMHELHQIEIPLLTHDNNIAKQAERIIRIQDGKIIEDSEVA